MQLFFPIIATQFNFLGGAVGVAVAVVVSFVLITLVASYHRFQQIVALAEESNPEEMGATADDIMRVQLARYLAGCGRRGTSFSAAVVRLNNPDVPVRMGTPFIDAIKHSIRCDDVTCIRDDQTAMILAEVEPEDAEALFARVVRMVGEACPEIASERVSVGVASYPGHGLSGKELLAVADEGLAQASPENPVVMPEIVDHDAEDEEDAEVFDEADEKDSKGWNARRKGSMLDELTGVLKPAAVSAYMQRMMNDLRQKKKKAALFCIGVNNVDQVARIYGDEAVDDVLVGISNILKENFRVDDLIGRHEKHAFLVLAPISLEEAEIIGKRISTLVQRTQIPSGTKKLKTAITLGVAAYPQHGRNLHHLYASGQKVLDHSRANDIRAYAVYDPEIHDKVASKPMRNIKSVKA